MTAICCPPISLPNPLERFGIDFDTKNLPDLASRVQFIFKKNLYHLIPVFVAVACCFIPLALPGATFGIGLASATGALSTSISYLAYQLIQSWKHYPYDYLSEVEADQKIVQRSDLLERMINYLTKEEENNVLLLGDPGTGKTTMAKALAATKEQHGYTIYMLEWEKLFGGYQNFGDLSMRLLAILEVLHKKKVILFIDEAQKLLNANGVTPTSEMLKSFKGLRIFAATTLKEYQRIQEDKGFDQRFNKVKMPKLSEEMLVDILQRQYPSYSREVALHAIAQAETLYPQNANPRATLQLMCNERHRHKQTPPTKETLDETVAFERASLLDLYTQTE